MKTERISNIYPLTPMQEGMLFHYLKDTGTKAYVEQHTFNIRGHIDLDYLQESFEKLIDRYDILRTVFHLEETKKPVQIVLMDRRFQMLIEDISSFEIERKQRFLDTFLKDDLARGFNLSKDLLIRISLFKLNDDSFRLVWTFHHIIMDGWCIGILVRDLLQIYGALQRGEPISLEPPLPYNRYIKWLADRDRDAGLVFWKDYLWGYEEQSGFSKFGSRKSDNEYKLAEYRLEGDAEISTAVIGLAEKHRVTVNMVFQALWGVLLQRYNNTDDVVFGIVISGRPPDLKGIERMVGLFINTIPIRIWTSANENIGELLARILENTVKGKPHEYLPLAEIQSQSFIKTGLFDHILAFENYPLEKISEDSDTQRKLGFDIEYMAGHEQSEYDFNIIILPGSSWVVKFVFNALIYEENFIRQTARHWKYILEQVTGNPELQLRELQTLTDREKAQLLFTFNNSVSVFPQNQTVHGLVEQQIDRVPDRVAAAGNKTNIGLVYISYRKLNEISSGLAFELREIGVTANTVVALSADRSTDLVIGLLGILKSGGCYLPIDIDSPQARIKYILDDCGTGIVLTGLESGLPVSLLGEKQWDISGITDTELRICQSTGGQDCVPAIPYIHPDPSTLAYIIYTSGTTGSPKGVLIRHRGIVNLICYRREIFGESSHDKMSQVASPGFDAMAYEIWPCLSNGAGLHIADREIRMDPTKMKQWLIRFGITVSFQPTVMAVQLLSEDWETSIVGLKILQAAGEKLTRYPERPYPFKLYNLYGPTEDSVWTTWNEVEVKPDHDGLPGIGSPVGNHQVFILDSNFRPQPPGIGGELCIGGIGLSQGYLNNPELTAEKFINWENTNILYRTGDLACWRFDGQIEFLGRNDCQVKIRGFRIELGEIEKQIMRHEYIREAIVLPREDSLGDKSLVAYIILSSGQQMNLSDNTLSNQLRQSLSAYLPQYMIPAYWIQLDKIPLTPNGKVDRKALPELEWKIEENYTGPRDEIESRLVKLWWEVLEGGESGQNPALGIYENFFERGGHSLKATMLSVKIQKEFNVRLPLTEIFSYPDVAHMASYIRTAERIKYTSINPIEKRDYYELSPSQKRLYILQQMVPKATRYNLPELFELSGSLNTQMLEKLFIRILKRHEALRTSFRIKDTRPVQQIRQNVNFKLEFWESLYSRVSTLISDFIRPFDLTTAPLLRIGIVRLSQTGSRRHILMIDMHHIVSDGMSINVLIKDFTALYGGEKPEILRIQYKEYAEWQNRNQGTEFLVRQEDYWARQFVEDIPILNLPIDFSRPPIQSPEGDREVISIDEEISTALKALAIKNEVTMYMLLIAAFYVFLAKLSGQENIIVGTPIAARRHADLQPIIGMFVNTLALQNSPVGDKPFHYFLNEVKEKTLAAFENQEYPFEMLVEKISVQRDSGRNPLFDVMFALQNMETAAPEIPGLTIKTYPYENKSSKFDLTLIAIDTGKYLRVTFEYCTRLFKRETILLFTAYFRQTLTSILENYYGKISAISVISAEEKQKILFELNNCRADYSVAMTIHGMFEEQAEKTPESIALIGSAMDRGLKNDIVHLTYRELDNKTQSLANHLKGKIGGVNTIIGIQMERSPAMIIGILGILKSGSAYLPLDPQFPEERKKYMLADSGAELLLNIETLMNIEEKMSDQVHDHSISRSPLPQSTDDNLAYIIYTSGTTGRPKGILTTHHNVLRVVINTNYIALSRRDRILQLSNFAFDGSVFDIYGALLNGAVLVLPLRDQVLDVDQLAALIEREQITVFFVTTALFNALVDRQCGCLGTTRKILFGGERVSTEHTRRAVDYLGRGKVIHVYGPTESTVFATYYPVDYIEEDMLTIPIGLPLKNTSAYIMDRYQKSVPNGVTGELFIGGGGLARGYLNRPELSADKFKLSPIFAGKEYFHEINTLYKTGDLVRRLPDGNIDFVGRIDGQVKIRGFRIELGEIESRLMNHEQVKEAVVLTRELGSGNTQLVAYLVPELFEHTVDPDETSEINLVHLRQYLSQFLPAYMVPSYYIELEKLPLNPNGKLDEKSLPIVEAFKSSSIEKHAKPATDREKLIAAIWMEVLNLEEIGIDENFFDVGGNSLNILQVNQKLNSALECSISPISMFRFSTIRSLSQFLSEEEGNIFNRNKRTQALSKGKSDIRLRYQKRRQQNRNI